MRGKGIVVWLAFWTLLLGGFGWFHYTEQKAREAEVTRLEKELEEAEKKEAARKNEELQLSLKILGELEQGVDPWSGVRTVDGRVARPGILVVEGEPRFQQSGDINILVPGSSKVPERPQDEVDDVEAERLNNLGRGRGAGENHPENPFLF